MGLIVVDMQTEFPGTESAMDGVLWLIKRARRRSERIVVLSFFGNGEIERKVRSALQGYNRVTRVRKRMCDGSWFIEQRFKEIGYQPRSLEFCGVYTSQCVRETFFGMANRLTCTPMTLIPQACGEYGGCSRVVKGIDDIRTSCYGLDNTNVLDLTDLD